MFNMLNSKTIQRIVLKKLDYNTALILDRKLNNISSKKCEALFIDIAASSSTGITQCEDFVTQIQQVKKKGVPVYTFGNEAIIGPSLLVLLAGDYSFIDRNTMMGLFDFHSKRNIYHKFLKEKNFQVKLVTAGRHKIRLNPFEEIKDEDKEWAVQLLSKQKELFIEQVQQLRGNRLKLSQKQLEETLTSNFVNNGEALKSGLIDGFHSVDTFRLEKFRNKQIKDTKINPFELLQNATKVGEAFTSEEISISEYLDQAEAEFMTSVFNSTLQYDIRI